MASNLHGMILGNLQDRWPEFVRWSWNLCGDIVRFEDLAKELLVSVGVLW